MTALDLIINRHPRPWRQTATGETHFVVFACPCEVVSISENGTWSGKASQFIREFEEANE